MYNTVYQSVIIQQKGCMGGVASYYWRKGTYCCCKGYNCIVAESIFATGINKVNQQKRIVMKKKLH